MTPLGRIAFHIRFGWTRFKSKRGWPDKKAVDLDDLDPSPEEIREIEALAKQHIEEYEERRPVLEPRRTILFADSGPSAQCSLLNARKVRKWVTWVCGWAIYRGFTAFLVDYATPFGMLALDTLNGLRKNGASFQLYTYRGTYRPRRRSYRLIPETDVEVFLVAGKGDYHFSSAEGKSLPAYAGVKCTASSIWISRKHIPQTPLRGF